MTRCLSDPLSWRIGRTAHLPAATRTSAPVAQTTPQTQLLFFRVCMLAARVTALIGRIIMIMVRCCRCQLCTMLDGRLALPAMLLRPLQEAHALRLQAQVLAWPTQLTLLVALLLQTTQLMLLLHDITRADQRGSAAR